MASLPSSHFKGKALSLCLVSIMLVVGFLYRYYDNYQVENVPFYCYLLGIFIMSECWILSVIFLCVLRWSRTFSSQFIDTVNHNNWFLNIKLTLFLKLTPLSMICICYFFSCIAGYDLLIFVGILCHIHKVYWCVGFIYILFIDKFCYRVVLTS